MKKTIKTIIVVTFFAIAFCGLFCGCDSKINDTADFIDEEFKANNILSTYSLNEMLDLYEEQHPETFRNSLLEYVNNRFDGLPNMALIMEEIAEQGHQEEYATLFQVAEKIGYYPSALVGEQCLDLSTNIIHLTNGSCLSNIKALDMYFLCETSVDDLLKDMENDDAYIKNCTLCEKCWANGPLGYLEEK